MNTTVVAFGIFGLITLALVSRIWIVHRVRWMQGLSLQERDQWLAGVSEKRRLSALKMLRYYTEPEVYLKRGRAYLSGYLVIATVVTGLLLWEIDNGLSSPDYGLFLICWGLASGQAADVCRKQFSKRAFLTVFWGLIVSGSIFLVIQVVNAKRELEGIRTTRTPNQRVETNRRPAFPLDAGREPGRTVCGLPFSSAALAHACRSAEARPSAKK